MRQVLIAGSVLCELLEVDQVDLAADLKCAISRQTSTVVRLQSGFP